jgi:hypothetical protein
MTPKDKALELYNKYEQLGRDFTRGVSMKEFAKQCALIAVDEILNNFGRATEGKQHYTDYNTIEFYTKVKHEIEHL